MEPTPQPFPSLADVEREVAAEGREWTRWRLQERLQHSRINTARFFPLRQRRRRNLTLRNWKAGCANPKPRPVSLNERA